MRLFGLIGYPLSHSFSQKYFTEKFRREGISDADYRTFPLESIKTLPELIAAYPNLEGLNVTIPYKQDVQQFLHTIDPVARAIGAVNTITINRTSGVYHLSGYNTDAAGFEKSFMSMLMPWHTRALILGTGGASKAVGYVLHKHGIPFLFVSRSIKPQTITYEMINENVLGEHKIIINTSPVGMYPYVDNFPDLPYHLLTQSHLLYDLVYNPDETMFLKRGKEMGAHVCNGLEMLHQQAEKAWEIWNTGR